MSKPNRLDHPFPENSFPETLNRAAWQKYLGRELVDEEYSILEAVKDETAYNKELKKLYENVRLKGLYIPKLTPRNGNCLFESLKIIGVCNDHDEFRQYLAHMLYLFKDYKNIFKTDPRSLSEMFTDTNEIEYVWSPEDRKIYKYTFETMCQDFASGFSWTRLPTQIILQFMSVIMNVKFQISSNLDDFVLKVDVNLPEDDPQDIFLGHIGEQHYVPLAIRIGKDIENRCPEYRDAFKYFYNWATMVEIKINTKHIEESDSKAKSKSKSESETQFSPDESKNNYVEVSPSTTSDKQVCFD